MGSISRSCSVLSLCWLVAVSISFQLQTAEAGESNHRYKDSEEVVLWVNKVGPYNNPQVRTDPPRGLFAVGVRAHPLWDSCQVSSHLHSGLCLGLLMNTVSFVTAWFAQHGLSLMYTQPCCFSLLRRAVPEPLPFFLQS